MQKLYKEMLSVQQTSYLENLASLIPLGFILYGSTATALQIAHRQSNDFDFFWEERFSSNMSIHDVETLLLKTLPFLSTTSCVKKAHDMLRYRTKDAIEFSFFPYIKTGRIKDVVLFEESLQLASLEDLFAYKLNKFTQRTKLTDYQDLSFMLEHGLNFEEGLNNAGKLFNTAFSRTLCIQAIKENIAKGIVGLSEKERKIIHKEMLI